MLGGNEEEWSHAGGRKISGENMASHCERGNEGGRREEEEEDTCENVTSYSAFLENKPWLTFELQPDRVTVLAGKVNMSIQIPNH